MGGGGDCGKARRQLGDKVGVACLSFPSSWSGAPPSSSHCARAPEACLWGGKLLGSTWVGREVGLKIRGFQI